MNQSINCRRHMLEKKSVRLQHGSTMAGPTLAASPIPAADHDNLNGCQCLMFFAPLNNLWSHQ